MVGAFYTDGGFANCTSNAVTAAFIDTLKYGGKTYTGDCGAVVGKVEGSDYNVRSFKIINTFCHGFRRSDSGTKRYDADLVPEL